ncbi:hypothetical protein [Chryseobacterium sp. ISL-6]|uniref:PGAP1-like alpha/beta domain-containing protein n=1 Tax=Chryseobacterium sp. ISL-6 TaxID=2819143 RepID=UPI001BE8F50D|nr:hypothetical protein [Chryseobacterium sp. ISL-6]MBT2622087.1 hypothetical protein [Chryseobacterium sp. ISL-6]
MSAKNPGVDYNTKDPIQRSPISKYFVRGWWTDENEKLITEAFLGDIVHFHIETQNIPDNNSIATMLYDDDVKKRPVEESDGKQGSDAIELGSNGETTKLLNHKIVMGNKVTIRLKLGGILANMIDAEEDKQIELFFACSYKGENIELPHASGEYLKVKKAEPLIIYICGYWNKTMPYAGTEWGEDYWGDGLKSAAKKYFKSKKEYFINGAGTKFSSGGSRYSDGKKLVNERLNNKQSKFYKEVFLHQRDIMIVSHSMGGAFAEGMISVMKQKNINIEKVVHLSPADVSEFKVTLPEKTFQIDIDWDPVLMYKNANDAVIINGLKSSGLAKNPKNDKFGHMYTKEESFVWNWFEDLESINFQFINEETKTYYHGGGGMGYGGSSSTVLQKNYNAMNLKNNTKFIRVIKNSTNYFFNEKNNTYYTEGK